MAKLFSFFSKKKTKQEVVEQENTNKEEINVVNNEEVEQVVTPQKEQQVETLQENVEEHTDLEQQSDELKEESQSSVVENAEISVEDITKTPKEDITESTQEVAEDFVLKEETKEEIKVSFFDRLKKTRDNLAFGISSLIKGRKIDDDLYEELETALLTADLGVETTNTVIERLKQESKLSELHDASKLKVKLKEILRSIINPCEIHLDVTKKENAIPFVILMVGVNGAGKTTTIGKLAQKYKAQGHKVMLAAGDTFRAAAVEQLKEWGNRTNTPVISQPTGSDSASVLYDALMSAKSKNIDVLICDTAGRLQNKENLMDELKKIVRVMKKIDENVPHEVLLVLDATTGQNAVSQATLFSQAVSVSGLALTKLDGTAKGGVVFSLADKFKLPIRFVGIGEKASDLKEFDAEAFVSALIDDK